MEADDAVVHRYMSGAKADAILARTEGGRPKKKKRRMEATPVAVGDGSGLLIADEDSLTNAWGPTEPEEEETDAPGKSTHSMKIVLPGVKLMAM